MLPHWMEGYATVNGAQMHYWRTGAGSGKPAMVLAHGVTDNGLCLIAAARGLEDQYDVVLPDARGHGLSARVQPGEPLDSAADLAGLIQALGLEQPVIGGHSMGAGTTSALAARWPNLARALILEDPGWRDESAAPPPPPPGSNPWWESMSKLANAPVEKVMAKGRADNPTWPEIEMRPWAEAKKQFDLNFFQLARLQSDYRETARAIRIPTLLITADPSKGAIVTPEIAQEVQQLNPLFQVVNIPGAGHNIRRENYPAYMAAVQAFLAGLPG